MPFYALPYHIGVWKGMEGQREGNGHKLEEGRGSKIFNTCQVVDAIDEWVDAAVQNGGEVKDVTQDWMDLGEKGRNILF